MSEVDALNFAPQWLIYIVMLVILVAFICSKLAEAFEGFAKAFGPLGRYWRRCIDQAREDQITAFKEEAKKVVDSELGIARKAEYDSLKQQLIDVLDRVAEMMLDAATLPFPRAEQRGEPLEQLAPHLGDEVGLAVEVEVGAGLGDTGVGDDLVVRRGLAIAREVATRDGQNLRPTRVGEPLEAWENHRCALPVHPSSASGKGGPGALAQGRWAL